MTNRCLPTSIYEYTASLSLLGSVGDLLASRSALIKALTSMTMFAAITANGVQKRIG